MIQENVKEILESLPKGIKLLAATKTRSKQEIQEAIDAGIEYIGENYIQEAKERYPGLRAKKHFIGHLQTNKAKDAIEIFDLIETVDSLKIAKEISKRSIKEMPILIEVNSGKEQNKSGVMPDHAISLIHEISELPNIKIKGLMTMAPFSENPEDLRPYFRLTKQLFDKIKTLKINNVDMEILSMGMSDSYKIAIEEGSNLIRIGTKIFGVRN